MVELEITIPIAAEWPSKEELIARNAVEDTLNSNDTGVCSGAGGGMGKMHLTYRVSDEATGRRVIADAMKTHMPGIHYDVKSWGNDL
jgi:hypothetical protein